MSFDKITVEYPLPEAPEFNDFQTHGLGCDQQEYTITKEGRLIFHNPIVEMVEDNDPMFGGQMTTIRYDDEDTCHEGDLYIYSRGRVYRFCFVDGAVKSVRRERE